VGVGWRARAGGVAARFAARQARRLTIRRRALPASD
jgi:hypothetical protein